jgi:dTDP-4-amino-4,6-dideoxygalactose transaminase
MVGDTKIRSAFPFFDEESISKILKGIESVLRSGVLTDGQHVKDFERLFAEYVGVEHAVAVSSGTSALEIALRYFELKGREVIVPTNTFVATPNSVLFAGGRPVFADIREDTLCIDPDDVEKKISQRTAGVIVVHVAGLVCPQMKMIVDLCEDNGLFLLEDAAHAHGAMIDGEKAGALADAGCFSFYPTKVITTGEGGMITTDCSGLAEKARCMRTHGLNSQRLMVMMGHNWRMSEIAAVIGKHQLDTVENFVSKRNKIAEKYESALREVDGASLFRVPANIRHSYYKYPVKLDESLSVGRLSHIMREKYGIETGNVYYPPCHLHPYYRENFGTGEGDLPTSERVLRKVLCLPMHYGMTDKDVTYVSEALRQSIERARGC